MNRKSMIAVWTAVSAAALTLTSCGYKISITRKSDEGLISEESESASENEAAVPITCVEGCICYMSTVPETVDETVPRTVELPTAQVQTDAEENADENDATESQTQNVSSETDKSERISKLTEGEIAARRKQQANFVQARDSIYKITDSLDKTERINQMDRQILANNTYDFSDKTVVFIGDSITEGITSAIDQNGNYVSYVTYANSYLHFENVLNHGKGGRMFTTYGGDELSLSSNFGNVTNINSDIIVVFAGVNDYLGVIDNKRFGNIEDTLTTGNYCGSVRYFMAQLKQYYGDREIFFVTMYDINKKSYSTYVDYVGQPTLGDFMDVQKKLAKEFGFNVIDLYGTGFMNCSTKEASDYFLRDGLHPKDQGNIFLGEHIAAELSLYFGQKAAETIR